MKRKITLLVTLSMLAMSMLLTSCSETKLSSVLRGEGSESSGASSTDASVSQEAESGDESPEATEVVKVTPTFMFFTSNSDADHDKTMAAVEELKKTYGEKIKFELVDIDENPEAKENFPVDGQTPTLIMLNTLNDICAFEFKITDTEKMEEAIKKALEE